MRGFKFGGSMVGSVRSRIAGSGAYLPPGILSNSDLEKIVDTTNDWIVERTGIVNRHISRGETAVDLAQRASEAALADAGLSAKDIDMIVVATVTGENIMPSTACSLQYRLGCRNNIVAFDILAACSGFVYALSIADQFIRGGSFKKILVVGSEVFTRHINYKERETCILFGDGAGAWILSASDEKENSCIMSTHLHADGEFGDLFNLKAGGRDNPVYSPIESIEINYMKMKGKELFKTAVRSISDCCQEALAANGVAPESVDWVIPHQANKRILSAVGNQIGLPEEKMILSLHETGNTSAASIPIAFEFGRKENKIKRGDLILIAACGAGITSGSALLKY